jgi:hypothetical protein
VTERSHDFEKLFKNAQIKCGKSVKEIVEIAIKTGNTKTNVKAREFYSWIAEEFGLGQGYAQAIWINFDEISDRNE